MATERSNASPLTTVLSRSLLWTAKVTKREIDQFGYGACHKLNIGSKLTSHRFLDVRTDHYPLRSLIDTKIFHQVRVGFNVADRHAEEIGNA